MNVNPESSQFGTVKPWDSLTEAEKASGDWIELPAVDASPKQARRRSVFDSLPVKEYKPNQIGKIVGAPGYGR